MASRDRTVDTGPILATVWPGTPYPLGATYDGAGTNFSLFSEVADAVELCLIGTDGTEERIPPRRGRRLRLARVSARRSPRASATDSASHGPWDPAAGHRCDPSKLLLDPYGKAFDGDFKDGPAMFSYDMAAAEHDDSASGTRPMIDSLGHTMTSVVINPFFDWASDRAPRRPTTRRSSTRRTSRA